MTGASAHQVHEHLARWVCAARVHHREQVEQVVGSARDRREPLQRSRWRRWRRSSSRRARPGSSRAPFASSRIARQDAAGDERAGDEPAERGVQRHRWAATSGRSTREQIAAMTQSGAAEPRSTADVDVGVAGDAGPLAGATDCLQLARLRVGRPLRSNRRKPRFALDPRYESQSSSRQRPRGLAQRPGRALGQRRPRARRPAARPSRGSTARAGSAPPATASSRPRAARGPAARAASSVSSVWLIVPRPGRAATTSGMPQVEREVAHEVAGRDRHHQPADALADERVRPRRRAPGRREQLGRLERRARRARPPGAAMPAGRTATAPPRRAPAR